MEDVIPEVNTPEPDAQTPQAEPEVPTATNAEVESLLKQVKDLRSEAAKYRTKAKDFENQLTSLNDQLTSKDVEISKLNAAFRITKITSEVGKLATELGITDIDAVIKLSNLTDLEDNDLSVEKIKENLESVKTAHPVLFGTPGQAPVVPKIDAASKGETGPMSFNDILRNQIVGK